MIKAITFDLWDTVIHDDSDEPKRRAAGVPSKREARRQLAVDAFTARSDIDRRDVLTAYETMEAAFNHVWHDQLVTWTVSERIAVLERGLGHDLPSNERRALALALEEMEVQIPPDPIPGVAEALEQLSARFRLGVVSDAIYSPGRCLRQWLEMHGLIRFFSGFAFSDEVGHSKPHRSMFESVAGQLGVRVEQMLHIGDRDHNDVKGPHRLGMKAILFTATRDRDKDATEADAICEHYADLPGIIERVVAA
ncbi:MAG: HAD family hydrolase [Gammaproteobacteria bacterium]|nr:HAD family hydrolase [Gammaproteobacteria bacterium]